MRERFPGQGQRARTHALHLWLAGLWAAFSTPLLSGTYTTIRTCDYVQKSVIITADTTLNIKLPEGYLVSGIVRDSTGAPVLGAGVSGLDQDGFGTLASYTGTDGTFCFPARAGRYHVTAWPPPSVVVDPAKFPRLVRARVGPFTVSDDTEIDDITLPDGYVVSGKVSADGGTIGALCSTMVAFKTDKSGSRAYAATVFDGSEERGTQYIMALPKGKYTQVLFSTQAFSITTTYPRVWTLLPSCSFHTSALAVGKDLAWISTDNHSPKRDGDFGPRQSGLGIGIVTIQHRLICSRLTQ
ncbi:MAG: carboxypeptidase-like regulatory domain-containing protein, partial [Acidobacteriota bacterium]